MAAFLKFIKFCIVGGSGVFVDFSVTCFFKEIIKINKYIANSIGFIVAATTNYMLNRIWTFVSNQPNFLKEYFIFFLFSLIGLAFNNGIIYLLHDKMKVNFSKIFTIKSLKNREKVDFYCAKLIAITLVTFWNFFMNYFLNFK
ncbi:MAG: GtrA family protein [Bacteroidales bacterium]|jgi:putative flippase GtrA|nr:GtrA family protein [Bacteroidales bacterium]